MINPKGNNKRLVPIKRMNIPPEVLAVPAINIDERTIIGMR
jgi:hypothetical protein